MKLSKKIKVMIYVLVVAAISSAIGMITVMAANSHDFTVSGLDGASLNVRVETSYDANTREATSTQIMTINGQPALNNVASQAYGYFITSDEIPTNFVYIGNWYVGNLSTLEDNGKTKRFDKTLYYTMPKEIMYDSYTIITGAEVYKDIERNSGIFPAANRLGDAYSGYDYYNHSPNV